MDIEHLLDQIIGDLMELNDRVSTLIDFQIVLMLLLGGIIVLLIAILVELEALRRVSGGTIIE